MAKKPVAADAGDSDEVEEKVPMVTILNNAARLIHPTFIDHKGGQTVVINLMPGINLVEQKKWARVENSGFVKQQIKDEEIEVLDDDVVSLAGMKTTKASGLIKQTFDRRLLNTWLVDEERTPAIKALKAQLKRLDQ